MQHTCQITPRIGRMIGILLISDSIIQVESTLCIMSVRLSVSYRPTYDLLEIRTSQKLEI